MSGKEKDIVQMRYALVNGELAEPQAGLHGECPFCHEEVLSKCGDIKVHHWAHVNKGMCDPWWENKTEWHRKWQDKFPKEWQEVRIDDKDTGIWHVADVCTPDGLVVEFQHSYMDENEKIARERFYTANAGDMVWVVDVDKKNAVKKFINNQNMIWSIDSDEKNVFYLPFVERVFPEEWLNRKKSVFFDVLLGENRLICGIIPSNVRKDDWFLTIISREQFQRRIVQCNYMWPWSMKYETSVISRWYCQRDKVRKLWLERQKIKVREEWRAAGKGRIMWQHETTMNIEAIENVNLEMQKYY